jgi:hypothetical protein
MISKTKRLSEAKIAALEAKRDICEEILQSFRELKVDKGHIEPLPIIEAEHRLKALLPSIKGSTERKRSES